MFSPITLEPPGGEGRVWGGKPQGLKERGHPVREFISLRTQAERAESLKHAGPGVQAPGAVTRSDRPCEGL